MEKAVICVDDEAIILMCLRQELLERFGSACQIEAASDAEAAFDIIAELIADGVAVVAVISDWLMPGLNGGEFLTRVHRQYPSIQTLLITGQADEDAISRIRDAANLRAVFSKPWPKEELLGQIADCLK